MFVWADFQMTRENTPMFPLCCCDVGREPNELMDGCVVVRILVDVEFVVLLAP